MQILEEIYVREDIEKHSELESVTSEDTIYYV